MHPRLEDTVWGDMGQTVIQPLENSIFATAWNPCEKHCIISRVVRARSREVTAKFQHWLQSLQFTGRGWRLAAHPLTIDIFLCLGFLQDV
jgi:hypothetical protein